MLSIASSRLRECARGRTLQSRSGTRRSFSTNGEAIAEEKPAARKSLISSYQECMDEVKRLDYPHYFCSRYLPSEARITSIALRNLNIETAAIKSHIASNNTAHVRLHWWRQAIDKAYKGDGGGHPATELLQHAVREGKLTKGFLLRLIDARERDLATSQPRTMDTLEQYAEDTASSLNYLLLEALNVRDLNADHAASHLGKAQGLVTLIRALPFHSKSKQVYIPTDLTANHNITSEMLFRNEFTPQIGEAVYEIASLAHGHIEMARELTPSLPKDAYLAFLPTEFFADYLERLRYANFNPWDSYLNHNSALTRAKIVKNYYTSKF